MTASTPGKPSSLSPTLPSSVNKSTLSSNGHDTPSTPFDKTDVLIDQKNSTVVLFTTSKDMELCTKCSITT